MSIDHRGEYAIKEDSAVVSQIPTRGLKILGMGKEFTVGDKAIYIAVYTWIFGWLAVFIVGTIYNITHEVEDASWLKFWHIYVWMAFVVGVTMVTWFTIGGLRDLRNLFRDLRKAKRNDLDDGSVVDHHNLGESVT